VLLAAFTGPVLLLGIIAYQLTQGYIREQVNASNQNVLEQIREKLDMIVDDVNSVNLTFSSGSEMIGMLRRAVNVSANTSEVLTSNAILQNLLVTSAAARPYVYSIYIYIENPGGNFLSSDGGLASIANAADQSWFTSYQRHRAGPPRLWSEGRRIVRYSFEQPIDVITFYHRFFSADGLAVLNVRRKYLVDQIAGLRLAAGQRILVLDAANQLVLGTGDETAPLDIEAVLVRRESSFTMAIEGEEQFVTRLAADRFGWNYISVTPLASMYTTPRRMGRSLVAVLAATVALCVALALLITRRTYRSVANLVSVLESAEAGEPLPPLPAVVRDEYDYIMQTILRNYLSQSALKRELAEKQLRMRILELVALETQITPHFLVNTLKAIFWMSFRLTGSNNEVCRMVENLSSILSYALVRDRDIVSLDEEIRTTRDYVAIEQTRYPDKFDVVWSVPEDAGRYATIRLLIQPLVENAIRHGLARRSGKGRIEISIEERDGRVELSVADNGVGIEPERLAELNRGLASAADAGEHIGIQNCSRRLALEFGESFGVRLESDLGAGTRAIAVFPRRTVTDPPADSSAP